MKIIVVGGGLFGSAAARHLAEAGDDVVVIASPEPGDYASTNGPFASHYDQGRIVRTGGHDANSSELASQSFAQFRQLAKRSGVEFFSPRPLVILSPDPDADLDHGRAVGADIEPIDLDQMSIATGITPPPHFKGGAIVESRTAGIVNPRLLVHAQLLLAKQAGAELIADSVVEVTMTAGTVEVTIANGRRVSGDQMVLATGAYGTALLDDQYHQANDAPRQLRHLQRRLRTIALIEVEGSTANLASLSASGFLYPTPEAPKLEEMYWVPPIRYPDGGMYLKIGGNSLPMITASSDDDIGAWFRGDGSVSKSGTGKSASGEAQASTEAQASSEAASLFALAGDLLPNRSLRLAAHKPCVVSYTTDERPIIERLSPEVVLALAGNGSGATVSEEVGRRAAQLAINRP